MFTGIIENIGKVVKMQKEGSNLNFTISSPISSELKIDQSVSHNGVCLTVVKADQDEHVVTAIDETLKKSNLGHLTVGSWINLERCMKADGRFDGHIVQGHVDQVAICTDIRQNEGSWVFDFQFEQKSNVVVEKGSICVNGISLTCFDCKEGSFSVAIIPYTFENTTMQYLEPGGEVNLEFDIVGKYVQKLLASG